MAMNQKSSKSIDLTTGSSTRVILLFALPMVFGSLFQQFYGIVDTSIVGHYLGVEAFAGVGATVSICYLFNGFGNGCCTGFGIPVARSFGAGEEPTVRRLFANALYLSMFLGIVVAVVTTVFSRSILTFMDTPDDLFRYALQYVRIIFSGLPLAFFYHFLAAMIRSLGNSRVPVLSLTAASLINIALDVLLIAGFRMGVAGAAFATITSQGLAALFCGIYILRRMPSLIPHGSEWDPDSRLLRELFNMGFPIGFQVSLTTMGSVIIQSAINSLGSTVVAASTAGSKIGYLFATFFEGLGTAFATYVSQNLGAGKPDRIRAGIRSCFRLGSIYSLVCFLFVLAAGNTMIRWILGNVSDDLITKGYYYAVIMLLFLPAVMFLNVFRYLIQSLGFPSYALFAGFSEILSRIVLSWFIIPRTGFIGVCFEGPMAWTLAALVLLIILVVKKERFRQVLAQADLSTCTD